MENLKTKTDAYYDNNFLIVDKVTYYMIELTKNNKSTYEYFLIDNLNFIFEDEFKEVYLRILKDLKLIKYNDEFEKYQTEVFFATSSLNIDENIIKEKHKKIIKNYLLKKIKFCN